MKTKIFTYVSPKSNSQACESLCNQLPITLTPVESIQELFPLLSNPSYHTDYVSLCVDTLMEEDENLDMFSVLLTLDTLIKSTVRRIEGMPKPVRRNTKIILLVRKDVNIGLLRTALNQPYIHAVALVLEHEDEIPHHIEYTKKLVAGEVTHDLRVLELSKPKKTTSAKTTNEIKLTVRQAQVLQLIQDRGASNKIIGKVLGLSESTVKLHIGAILKKYGAKNRTQLAVFSRAVG